MVKIVKNNDELAVCPGCVTDDFELVQSEPFPDEFMAFCARCGRGKSLELWQKDWSVVFITKRAYKEKYGLR